MTYIRTVPVESATGQLKEIYDGDIRAEGKVANHTLALSLRPEVIAAYRQLNRAIRAHLDQRRYELITTVAAARLRCRY